MSISPQRIGKYELQERLGRGGMAEVWKALDTQLGRLVAIKILHADLQVEDVEAQVMVRVVAFVAVSSFSNPS